MQNIRGKELAGVSIARTKTRKRQQEVKSSDANNALRAEEVAIAATAKRRKGCGSKDKMHHSQIMVVLDKGLGENAGFMEEFMRQGTPLALQYCVSDEHVPSSVRWVWSEDDGLLDQAARTVEIGEGRKKEDWLLVSIGATEFLGLVHYSTLVSATLASGTCLL